MASKAFRRLFVRAMVGSGALVLGLGAGPASADSPAAETAGSPIRTATTMRLEGRVDPRGLPTLYRFEYGTAGPCSSNPCQTTPEVDAGAEDRLLFVSQLVTGLTPGTTYHYRLVANHGEGSTPSPGADMVVKTRATDIPLSHGHFPGPPGSDRAWEQVNVADTGGNPVAAGYSFSDSGERAIYQILGGTPISDSGSAYNLFFAQRTASGWQSRPILPPRDEVTGPNWQPPYASDDLSQLFADNVDFSSGRHSFWRLQPGGSSTRLLSSSETLLGGFFVASDDLTRTVVALRGTADPTFPVLGEAVNLYDVGSGTPRLLSLMPSGSVAACGVGGSREGFGLPGPAARRVSHWLSPDGSLLFFPSRGDDCAGESQLYVRDIPAGTTARVSAFPVSGPACGAGFVKSTPGAVFFWSKARLVAADSAPSDCSGDADGDVYRYELETAGLECVTCVAGRAAEVTAAGAPGIHIAVAADGSRVYFASSQALLPGASAPGIYRVDVASGALAYVAPIDAGDTAGDFAFAGNALTPDGSVLIFRSAAAALNQLGGAQNGGTAQYYRYDDADRSLVCASCPQNGTPAPFAAVPVLASELSGGEVGPNADPLSDRGDFVFSTPNRLLGVDRNTAPPGSDPSGGVDLYEWRDGRLFLVSDGLTTWPDVNVAPLPSGVSPSGRDVFFTASARYTPDALDSYNRLYDARIGGGIDFPEPPETCPLPSCQSAPPLVLPEEPSPHSDAFFGPGNVKPAARPPRRCQKGKRKIRRFGKVRCVKQAQRHRTRR